jgi:hypothetical protein
MGGVRSALLLYMTMNYSPRIPNYVLRGGRREEGGER